jgi:hypothetical protein
MKNTILEILGLDYTSDEFDIKTPFTVHLINMIPGSERPDYWIGKLDNSFTWSKQNKEYEINYDTIATRWEGIEFGNNEAFIPVGISFVLDEDQVSETELDLNKVEYVAVGTAREI